MAKVQQNLPQRPKINMPKIPPILGGKSESPTDDIDKMGDTTTDQCEQKCCDRPEWLKVAKSQLGTKEFSGNSLKPEHNNPKVIDYLETAYNTRKPDIGPKKGDDIAWCGAFANWVVEKQKYNQKKYKGPSKMSGGHPASVKSWLNWGDEMECYGCLAVMRTGASHIGFVVAKTKDGKSYKILGGNQSNMVKYSWYSASKITTFRVPKGYRPCEDVKKVPIENYNGPVGKDSTR